MSSEGIFFVLTARGRRGVAWDKRKLNFGLRCIQNSLRILQGLRTCHKQFGDALHKIETKYNKER
jgi:hypothetical protein